MTTTPEDIWNAIEDLQKSCGYQEDSDDLGALVDYKNELEQSYAMALVALLTLSRQKPGARASGQDARDMSEFAYAQLHTHTKK